MIDCPGHDDFQFEVGRSLAAVVGAELLVDVQAQTVGNGGMERKARLKILLVVSKIDLQNADVGKVRKEVVELLREDN